MHIQSQHSRVTFINARTTMSEGQLHPHNHNNAWFMYTCTKTTSPIYVCNMTMIMVCPYLK